MFLQLFPRKMPVQKVAQELALSGQQSAIDVSDLNSGIYFVKVMTENGEIVKKFVKE